MKLYQPYSANRVIRQQAIAVRKPSVKRVPSVNGIPLRRPEPVDDPLEMILDKCGVAGRKINAALLDTI